MDTRGGTRERLGDLRHVDHHSLDAVAFAFHLRASDEQ